MKHLFCNGTVLMVAILLTGCAATTTAERTSTGGQAITGHEIVTEWEQASKVCFTTDETAEPVPGDDFCAVVSNEILEGKVPIASIYWHGDGGRKHFERTDPFARKGIFAHARRVVAEGPVVAVIRPHNTKYQWRQMGEIRLHIVLAEYINRAFGVKKFNFYGHSGGGLVAIAVATERPELTATVGLASPKLAVREHYIRHEGGNVPNRYYTQYDPIKHIKKLSPDIPVLIAYDERDLVVKPHGVFPYTKMAKELGLIVRLVLVRNNHSPYHSTQWHLGNHLRKPENREFSTQH